MQLKVTLDISMPPDWTDTQMSENNPLPQEDTLTGQIMARHSDAVEQASRQLAQLAIRSLIEKRVHAEQQATAVAQAREREISKIADEVVEKLAERDSETR